MNLSQHEQSLIEQGLARVYRGRLIPVMMGGAEDEDEPLFAALPEALIDLTTEELEAHIAAYDAALVEIAAHPENFVSAEFTSDDLYTEALAARDSLREMKSIQATRDALPAEPIELSADDAARFAELAAADDPAEEVEIVAEVEEPVEEAAVEELVVAAAAPRRRSLPAPSASREVKPSTPERHQVALTASAGASHLTPGTPYGSDLAIADAMIKRHAQFGKTRPGATEKFGIALADWTGDYPADRVLTKDEETNFGIIDKVIRPDAIKAELNRRRVQQINGMPEDLQASGGLCAPLTPYYDLQYISVPTRPVMSSLPSFNADRGGLRYARPAALSAVTTAIGIITEEEDAAGGTDAQKSCQTIPCPPFQETAVDTIYHCLQFGNLGARAFPELVAQWNNLVLAAHARLAESNLLTQIDAFSTQVVAGSLGLGASATLFSQILTAANGLRSRNRMDPEAVLRLMLPWWAVDLIISDVIRTQFQRFDTDRAKVIALLRSFNIEPTFYIDGANGRGQVYGTQADGALDPFPPDVVWYLFPEGSFLYLDGGTLELGIVRDSVLNAENNFQIFGETFENVAFVGVESLAVVTTTCDSGVVVAPADSEGCPISYAT